jgi:hypothetical protein
VSVNEFIIYNRRAQAPIEPSFSPPATRTYPQGKDCRHFDPWAEIIGLNDLVTKLDKAYISGSIVSGGLGHVLVKRNKGSHLSILDLLETQKKFMKVNNINQSQQNNYEAMIQDKPFVATQSDVSIIAGLIGKHAIDLLMNRNILKDDIYFFSTSNEFLGEAFTVQPLSANPRVNIEKPLDPTLIEKGKTIWKSLSLKK